MCIQETKIQEMSEGIVRSLGTGRFLDWRALNAGGAAAGWHSDYAGTEGHGYLGLGGGEGMWEELGAVRGLWDDPWVSWLGDFNITPFQQERSSQRRITSAMRRFAETVDELELVTCLFRGGEFTWNGGLNNQEIVVRGSTSYRLAIKMKEIKKRLKVWNKEAELKKGAKDSFKKWVPVGGSPLETAFKGDLAKGGG
ncbi:hypothetical protein CK203_001559 [Vitis vinifera]|uniref:Endonuclease/exonuclease/phosphatase domain-containing protein n=1 Tax=Vitis vinifera TaxID=29760 RepID=A0A438KKG1_VITVI|nr:hypothetical protein CK203_001559 [Vitis vinifera]